MFLQNLVAQINIGPNEIYKNIQSASTIIKPGDTIFVHAGSYKGYQGITGLKGTSKKPIVITRYKNDIHDISGNWQFQSCEYITFKNLNFKANINSTGRLINVDNNGDCSTQSNYIVFDSCSFSDVTDINAITSFKFGGVENFQVTNCIFKNFPNCSAFDFNVCHHGLIKGNYIENCQSAGHIKGGASDITMEQNTFVNASTNGWVVFEFGGDTGPQFYCKNDTFEVKNLRFYSNLIIGGSRGFALSSAQDCKVVNNTFYNCSGATIRLLKTSSLYPLLNNNIVVNNLFAFGSNAYMNGSTQQAGSTFFNNNIYYSLVNTNFNGPFWDTPEMDLVKENNLILLGKDAVMFVDTTKNNFHLAARSPAIGIGKTVSEPKADNSGFNFNLKRSIGAFEFKVPLTTYLDQLGLIDRITCFPNPSNGTFHLQSNVKFSSLEIINELGEIIYQNNICSDNLKIDLTSETKGAYLLKIKKINGGSSIIKLFIN